jgi:hypothetical protein
MLNLELADVALQGFTLTLQLFEFWGKGTLLAFHRGRSLRAKSLSFPSIERWPTNSEFFRQGLGTFLTAILPDHSSLLHGVRAIARAICRVGGRLHARKGLAHPSRHCGSAWIA